MYSIRDLHAEAEEAVERVWFVQSVQFMERTDFSISLRLSIRPDLFVQVFLGELSGSLFFALIAGGQRIFGIDRDSGEWHVHPYHAPHRHEALLEGLEPKPLLRFLARVEDLLIEQDLL
jgi:hypothetical protein